MRIEDLVRISFRQVFSQWWRNVGVLATISFGTAAFILVVCMGRSVESSIKGDLELIGRATRIRVSFEGLRAVWKGPPGWFRQSTVDHIRKIPEVSGVSLVAHKRGAAVYRLTKQYRPLLIAVDENYWSVEGFHARSGRLFGKQDVLNRQRVCVLGESLAQRIFGRMDITGQYLQIDNDLYMVVGIVDASRGTTARADAVFLPLTTAMDRIANLSLPNTLFIRCVGWDEVEPLADGITEIIRQLQPVEKLEVYVARKPLHSLQRVVWTVKAFVNLTVFATLALGSFGIWNTMMTSVRNRTREIGLKKIMGAEDRDIFAQFLTEAVCFSLSAVFIGIILSLGIMKILAVYMNTHPEPEVVYVFSAIGLLSSLVFGVGAGLTPAIKASRMQVVEAVRYE